MDNTVITSLHSSFEYSSKTQDGVTYWLAREIQPLLEYARWENFETAIERAKIACQNAEQVVGRP
jgi:DNA-damage-inducible protein D